MFEQWNGFKTGIWSKEIDTRDFIQKNYTPYDGDQSFLADATEATTKLWAQVRELMDEELKKGILDAETKVPSSITSHDAGYLNKELETIVGVQSDKPLKRNIMPNGGIRTVELALNSYGYNLDPQTKEIFTKYRKTHNTAVFQAYTKDMRACRHSHIITGLPDAYGRGRIVGDYRRIALYGIDFLIEEKNKDKEQLDVTPMTEKVVRLREEVAEQILALQDLKKMAAKYGFDISKPASDVKEAIQWLYFGYLGVVKQQDGAAMSIGRNAAFLDVYAERDLKSGKYTEAQIQEFIDHFIMKLRMIRFLRIPEYNELFSGDPAWVTEAIGGMGIDGRHMVTKTAYRILHTLKNLGPSPEPNLTILWSPRLPENFKKYCADVSIKTSSIQYENDELMRYHYGDDYTIACCVSAMKVGKEMQFFGARANLAKTLLYAINGGRDEMTGEQIGPKYQPVTTEYLDYDDVMDKFNDMMDWLARVYVDTLNVIHFMHDKYHYESLEMGLHDTNVERTFATGIAGFSVVVDSLSAIKYAKVKCIRDESGLVTDYEIEGEYPAYGNNDDRVDQIGVELVQNFMNKIRKHHTYRDSIPTTSILTITSNVVYGKKTGNTPDGRKAGQPLAPGANPMHGRDIKGAVASLASVAKLPFRDSLDGISNTFSVIPSALGKTDSERTSNLCGLLDGYFTQNPHHVNINVMQRETLLDAMDHPEKYPQLTIRVSGYAVRFIRLTREQQLDVINRTFHEHF